MNLMVVGNGDLAMATTPDTTKLRNEFIRSVNVHVVLDGFIAKDAFRDGHVQTPIRIVRFVIEVMEVIKGRPFVIWVAFLLLADTHQFGSFGGFFDAIMRSISNIVNFAVFDVVGVFRSRISVENDPNSGDVSLKSMLQKIVPNLLVKDKSGELLILLHATIK